MADLPEQRLVEWAEAIEQLHQHITREETDGRIAATATTNLWSDFGYPGGPPRVVTLVRQAIEIGYAAALRDVRDGDFDELIEVWQAGPEEDDD